MALLDLEALQQAQIVRDPCDFTVVREFVDWTEAAGLRQDFPLIAYGGLLPVEGTAFGPRFGFLVEALQDEALARVLSEKFELDLSGRAVSIGVRGGLRGRNEQVEQGGWHAVDGRLRGYGGTRLVTALLYFNAAWERGGWQMQPPHEQDELDAMIAEVLPAFGTLVAFRRPDYTLPDREPFVGAGRYLTINWMAGGGLARRGRPRVRVAAAGKHVLAHAKPG